MTRRWRTKYHLKYVTINDFYTCNLRCCYCFTQTESGAEHLTRQRTHDAQTLFEDMVARGYLAPDAVIHWGGGEVAIYPHFEPVASLLIENGVLQFVNTNALVYSPVIEQGLRQRRMVVQVSVDSGTPETYELIKGRPAFEVVFKNLTRYVRAGDVQVKYIIMEQNNSDQDVDGFLARCQAAGVKEIVVVPEAGELVRKAISEKTITSAARIMFGAIKSKIVINEDATAFGVDYVNDVCRELLSLLVASYADSSKIVRNLSLPIGFNVRNFRRHGRRAWRYLHSRGIGRRTA